MDVEKEELTHGIALNPHDVSNPDLGQFATPSLLSMEAKISWFSYGGNLRDLREK